jgi:NTE family protein
VLIVSVVGGASRTAAATPALAAAVAERAERELQDVRDGGSEVELIVPDDEAREVMGMNLMNGSKRAEIAQEGQRQGRAEAARLKEWWA